MVIVTASTIRYPEALASGLTGLDRKRRALARPFAFGYAINLSPPKHHFPTCGV
jgi:hypothetical protein